MTSVEDPRKCEMIQQHDWTKWDDPKPSSSYEQVSLTGFGWVTKFIQFRRCSQCGVSQARFVEQVNS